MARAIFKRVAELQKGVEIIEAGGGLERNAFGPTFQIDPKFFFNGGTEVCVVDANIASLDDSS